MDGARNLTMKQIFRLAHAEARRRAIEAIQTAPEGYIVRLSEPTRSLDQNAALWAMLGDVSRQVVWHGRKLDAEDWKNIFSASLRRLDVVPNLDSTGFVSLGLSTSKMTVREMGDMLDLIGAFGAEHNVIWSDK